jgi:hypothetical protein
MYVALYPRPSRPSSIHVLTIAHTAGSSSGSWASTTHPPMASTMAA